MRKVDAYDEYISDRNETSGILARVGKVARGVTQSVRGLFTNLRAFNNGKPLMYSVVDGTQDHMEHDPKKKQAFEEAMRIWSEFHADPHTWWEKHCESLVLDTDSKYIIICIVDGELVPQNFPHCHGNFTVPDLVREFVKNPKTKKVDELSFPGGGAFFKKGNAQEMVADLLAIGLTPEDIIAIMSHSDCAACNKDDAYAERYGRKLAEAFGNPKKYLGIIEKGELDRPAFHNAVGAWLRYDKKTMSPRSLNPKGPGYLDASLWAVREESDRVENIKLILAVAFKHGFNEFFTPENPFHLCVIANEKNKDEAVAEVQSVVDASEYADSIKVDLLVRKAQS